MPTEHEVRRTDGTVERTTTTDGSSAEPARRSGGMGTIVALIVGLLLVLVVGYFLMNMSQSEAVESNAIAGAAESVGAAADNVGEAAQSAVPAAE